MTDLDPSLFNQPVQNLRFDADTPPQVASINVPVEQAAALMVNGEDWLTFLCTPVQLEALALGFLFNERVIEKIEEVASFRVCNQYTIDVWLHHAAQKPDRWIRTSGCSGGKSAQNQSRVIDRVESSARLTPQQVNHAVQQMHASQQIYRETRGVHCSALSDGDRLYYIAEDIGRHNSFDKLAGMYLLSGRRVEPGVILTTGRVSSEMMQKASRIGSAFVVSITSPTNLSIQVAEEANITLIGYARSQRFNLYTHPERILNLGQDGREISLPPVVSPEPPQP